MTAEGRNEGLRLAVIDNDSGFVTVLVNRLEEAGWSYRLLASPVPPEDIAATRPDAIVVNLEVLGQDGWDYLDRLCRSMPTLGVVVCTGRSSVAQRVRGLRLGADDWLTKPCHPDELLSRVEAVVRRRRRADMHHAAAPKVIGELEIHADQFQAYVDGVSAELTRREYELLEMFCNASGQVLDREQIYQRVWGYSMAPGDRSVDVYVRKLRAKLARISPEWHYLHTHFGIGYRLAAEHVPAAQPQDGEAPADPLSAY